jgi:hypothetical protein
MPVQQGEEDIALALEIPVDATLGEARLGDDSSIVVS